VAEVSKQLDHDPDMDFVFDTSVTTLRNRVLGWLVDGFHAINNRKLIRRVGFTLCNASEMVLTFMSCVELERQAVE
jgi:hypothetical protein